MKSVKFDDMKDFKAPPQWDAEKYGPCDDLPVRVTPDHQYQSVWELNFLERLAILFGCRISLTVLGRQPPVKLEVVSRK